MFTPKFRTPHPSSKGLTFKKKYPVKVMVRHGASKKAINQGLRFPVEVNSIIAIACNANKAKMKELLEKAGVKTTESFDNTAENRQLFKDKGWNIVFKRRNHRRGIGMEFLTNAQIDTLADAKYNDGLIERRINVVREWRVHCAPAVNKIYALEKRRRHDAEGPARNIENCVFREEFAIPENWQEAIDVCNNAVKAIGLDVGAVDLAWSGKYYYVIEVNSGAGVGPKSKDWYADTYEKLIDFKVENRNK